MPPSLATFASVVCVYFQVYQWAADLIVLGVGSAVMDHFGHILSVFPLILQGCHAPGPVAWVFHGEMLVQCKGELCML